MQIEDESYMNINYQRVIQNVYTQLLTTPDIGKVADYIPALKRIDASQFGICLTTVDKQKFYQGDHNVRFSIQSIAKVIAVSYAFKLAGTELWQRVGVEPSGTAFNSLVQLEAEHGIPRNPFINAGAIVVCDVLLSLLEHPKTQLIEFVRKLSGNPNINYNDNTALQEQQTGYRNYALIYLMKDFGNIKNDIDEVLSLYFSLCSIEMNCQELSSTFLYLATEGINPTTGLRVINSQKTKRINALMQLCGFYDEAGEYSFKVGLPGKSGVGGGVIGIYPGKYCVAAWSPRLNAKGNSYRGMKVLEYLTTHTRSSVF